MAHILVDMKAGVDVRQLLNLSEQVRTNYMYGVQTVFITNRSVPEKHRGDNPAIIGDGGEYDAVKALAMTGEIWRAMSKWNPYDPAGCLPIGSLAMMHIA